MANLFDETIRIPFIIHSSEEKSILIPKEVYMDYTTGIMYIKNEAGDDIEAGKNTIKNIIDYEIEKIVGGSDDSANTLKKLQDVLEPLINWKDQMTVINNNDSIDTVAEILDKFKDMEDIAPTLINQIKLKVEKETGKGLSDEDFSDILYNKLLDIENNANRYIHPITKTCQYVDPVTSVNGRIGDVIINKEELGFGNVEESANYYIHPTSQQCNAVSIDSCNNKTGVVGITKNDVKLGYVENLKVLNESEIPLLINDTLTENKYMTPDLVSKALVMMKDQNMLINNHKPEIFTLTVQPSPSDALVKIFYKGQWHTTKSLQVASSSYYIIDATKYGYIPIRFPNIMPVGNRTELVNLIKCCVVTFTVDGESFIRNENSDSYFIFSCSSNDHWSENGDNWIIKDSKEWVAYIPVGYNAGYVFMCNFYYNGNNIAGRVVLKNTLPDTSTIINFSFSGSDVYSPYNINTNLMDSIFYYSSDNGITWNVLNNTGKFPLGTYLIKSTYEINKTWGPESFTIKNITMNYIDAIYIEEGVDQFFKLPVIENQPDNIGHGVTFSPDSKYLAVSYERERHICIYKRNGDIFEYIRVSEYPAVDGIGCAFSPDSKYLAITHREAPYLTVYKRNGDTFTKITINTLPYYTARSCAFSPDGKYLIVCHYSKTYQTIYKVTDYGFNKINASSIFYINNAYDCTFTPDGKYLIIIAADMADPIHVFERNNDTFTKLQNAITITNIDPTVCSISPNGEYLCVGCNGGAPYVIIYKINGSSFTKIAELDIPYSSIQKVRGCSFSYDNKYLAITHYEAPYLNIFKIDNGTFIKINNPDVVPSDITGPCEFSPASNHLAVTHRDAPSFNEQLYIYTNDKDYIEYRQPYTIIPFINPETNEKAVYSYAKTVNWTSLPYEGKLPPGDYHIKGTCGESYTWDGGYDSWGDPIKFTISATSMNTIYANEGWVSTSLSEIYVVAVINGKSYYPNGYDKYRVSLEYYSEEAWWGLAGLNIHFTENESWMVRLIIEDRDTGSVEFIKEAAIDKNIDELSIYLNFNVPSIYANEISTVPLIADPDVIIDVQ